MTAFPPLEHDLLPVLSRLDLLLRLAVDEFRQQARGQDPLRALYISDADIDELLASTPTAEIAQRLLSGPIPEASPRLASLVAAFGLDAFEQQVLLVCLAPELDLRYERLYAYLQDDATRRRATVGLLLRLLSGTSAGNAANARAALGPEGCLLRNGLLCVVDVESAEHGSLLARELRVHERVVQFLLGSDRPDPRLSPFVQLYSAADHPSEAGAASAEHTAVVRLITEHAQQPREVAGPIVYLHGAPGAAKRAVARAACAAAGRPLLLVDVPSLLADSAGSDALIATVREATLQDAVLGLDGFDLLFGESPQAVRDRRLLRAVLHNWTGPTLILGQAHWEPSIWFRHRTAVQLEVPILGASMRVQLWRSRLNGHLPPQAVAEAAARYRIVEEDAIEAVGSSAISRAMVRGDGKVTSEDVRAAARAVATPPLEGLARRVEPHYTWEDIVLSPDGLGQLRETCARIRFQALVLEQWGYGYKHARRSGMSALFAGPPGTGKTMAAEIVAGELGLDLYRIDLSAIVSKYIGETEKNLERIFQAADEGDAVLLFDEADAIFGKRSEVHDAHDRYANVEVAYLLQRVETYQGLIILTTNLRGNIEEAFLRRLDTVIEFPVPEEAERLAIWRRALPPQAPLGADVDLPFLARKFKLAGGHIRNIALTAGFLAAADGTSIEMRHLARATRREYQKLGKLVAESDFEQYYAMVAGSRRGNGTRRPKAVGRLTTR